MTGPKERGEDLVGIETMGRTARRRAYEKIDLAVPATQEFARVLRLAAAGIASRMDFDVDATEDIKMGLEEAFLIAVHDPDQHKFEVGFEMHRDRLEMVVKRLRAAASLEREIKHRFGFSILQSVMDTLSWHATEDESLRMVKFMKRSR